MQSRCICAGLLFALVVGLAGCSAQARPESDPLDTASLPAPAVISLKREASPPPLAPIIRDKSVSTAQPAPSPTAVFTPTPSFQLCSPLASDPLADLPQIISDPYRPPPPHHDERHQGVDFSYYRRNGRTSIEGVGVQSVLAGKVAAAVPDSFPFGNLVIVETPYEDQPPTLAQKLGLAPGESLYVLYAHMGKPPEVNLGDMLIACQQLGVVGKTGNAGVAHLHLETRLGPPGATFASLRYYDVHATQQEKDNYVLWSMSGVFRHFNPMDLLSWEYN